MKSILPSLTLLFVAAAGQAQECKVTDKVIDCWMRFNPAAGIEVTKETPDEAKTRKTVTAANTAISSLVSPSSSAVKDFLSPFSASLESKSLTSNGQALTFDYNPPINILGADHALKLQATFSEPALNKQLATHFASNPGALTPFDDGLTDTDDVALSGSVQPTSERFGRSIVPHRPLFRLMLNALVPDRSTWLSALGNAVASVDTLESEEQTFDSLPTNQQEAAMLAIETAAKNQQTFLRAVGGFREKFAGLLNNQPQLYATALYYARKNVVGPNELTAKLTYEMSAHNLNAFRRKHGSTCTEAALATKTTAAQCARLLQNFAGDDDLDDDRLTVSLEYHRTNQRWIKGDPDLGGFEFGYPRAHSFVFEVKYGRTLQGAVTGTSNGRIDLTFEYQDVRNPSDTSKNVKSRGVGAITYTQKINDSFSLPVSLVYANQQADLGDVDKKFNAHFGLVYKLPTGK